MKNKYKAYTIIHQPETEVYTGINGHIVIKQYDLLEEEQIVIFNPDNVKAIIQTLEDISITEHGVKVKDIQED
jgi:hypothetical protein